MKIKHTRMVCMLTVLSLGAMQKPKNVQIPITITNLSNIMVTILPRADDQGKFYMSLLNPNSSENQLNSYIPFVVGSGRFQDLSFATSAGHFEISIYKERLRLNAIEPGLVNRRLIQSFPVTYITNATVTVAPTGIPSLAIQIKKPNDGRPDVPLSVYKALTGDELYATPHEILGITPGVYAKKTYRHKVVEWHTDKNKSGHAIDAIRLIYWAAEQLGIK